MFGLQIPQENFQSYTILEAWGLSSLVTCMTLPSNSKFSLNYMEHSFEQHNVLVLQAMVLS